MFVYQGHRVKIKVTGAKHRVCVSYSRMVCIRLKDNPITIIITIALDVLQNVNI